MLPHATAADRHREVMSNASLAFVSSDTADARAAMESLSARYGQTSFEDAEVVVALGGDGFLLQTLRDTMSTAQVFRPKDCRQAVNRMIRDPDRFFFTSKWDDGQHRPKYFFLSDLRVWSYAAIDSRFYKKSARLHKRFLSA